jgi:Arc/MetJ-type ribon-helix-helix transcriptional regulator|tara:strand:+ start:307 stop:678 length:372 start_codon:yes stop_codon:yes gene_type:complete
MSGHSPMVSLRIPEDHLMAIDQRIGFDGMRNRSDVIRDAVRRLLEQPIIGNGHKVQVNLGPELTMLMRDFCKIHAEKPETVLKFAARDYIRRESIEGMSVTRLLQKRMEDLSARFDEDSNAQR